VARPQLVIISGTDPFRWAYLGPTLGTASKLPKTCRWSSTEGQILR